MDCAGLHPGCAGFHAERPLDSIRREAASGVLPAGGLGLLRYGVQRLRRDGAYGNRSLLLVVLRYDKEVGNGADEGASVLRDRLVALEHDIERNVGAILGAGVVLVL